MRVDRLLAIILYLSNRGKTTAKILAEHFEVTIRTIYRDIDKLCEAGVPICAEGGKGGGYYLMENYSVDQLYLGTDKMDSLLTIIDNVQNVIGKNDYVQEILQRHKDQRKESEDRFSINMSHFSLQDDIKDYMYLTSKAIKENKLLTFNYINRRFQEEMRIVEPVYISFGGGTWYLNGYCRIRNDYRRFKFIRMRNLYLGDTYEGNDITMNELKALNNKEFINRSIKVVLRFDEKYGKRLHEYFDKETITQNADGSYDAYDYFPHDEGLIRHILGFGTWCKVIEPIALREEVKAYLQEINHLYDYNT